MLADSGELPALYGLRVLCQRLGQHNLLRLFLFGRFPRKCESDVERTKDDLWPSRTTVGMPKDERSRRMNGLSVKGPSHRQDDAGIGDYSSV